jgi:hypothetical protein
MYHLTKYINISEDKIAYISPNAWQEIICLETCPDVHHVSIQST